MEETKMEEPKVEDVQTAEVCEKTSLCNFDTKKKIILGVILVVVIAGAAAFSYYKKNQPAVVSPKEIKAKIENLVAGGKVTVGDVVLDGDLYKVTITAGGKDQPVYVTKDGTRLIQEVISFDEIQKQKDAAKQDKPAPQEVTKSDKPTVELFVMSYCPYGTQMEKGILPVVAALGSKMDYNLRFVDYAMHGDKEIAENLRQYCIEKNQPTKLATYLGCFLKKGEGTSDACLAATGIPSASVKSCMAQVDAKFAVTKDAADKTTWSNGQFPKFNVEKDLNAKYAVQGSPTLVINGVVAEAGRDSASILKAICGAFTVAPKECEAKLSSVAPAPGFGEGAAPAASASAPAANASCGN